MKRYHDIVGDGGSRILEQVRGGAGRGRAWVHIEFMGEITTGRVIFGPDDVEPILGMTALESVGITIDPANRTLKRLPAIPLK